MEFDFWKQRWDANQTAFHEGKPNELLVAHADRLRGRILVPLAGKAVDLDWLAERGHTVVGVEFVQNAIDQLFAGRDVRTHKIGSHDAFTSGSITMVRADMFDVGTELGRFDAIYDRAALVALEPQTRRRYVDLCSRLSELTLLIAFSYDQTKSAGPPFSVDETTVRDLYAGKSIETLGTRAASVAPRLREAGVEAVTETIYLIRA